MTDRLSAEKNRTYELLQDEAQTKRREQRLQGSPVEETYYRALDQDSSQPRNDKRRRYRHKNGDLGVTGHRHLDNVGRVRAEHHQLAVSHVDDSHDAKRNRESDGGQYEHGPQTQSEKQRLDARIERAPLINGLHDNRGGLPHLLIAFNEAAVGRFLEQNLQSVPHILAEAAAERRNSVETCLRICAIQRSERQTCGQFLFDSGICFHAVPLAQ